MPVLLGRKERECEAAAAGAAAWTIELRVAADEKEWEGCVPCSA